MFLILPIDQQRSLKIEKKKDLKTWTVSSKFCTFWTSQSGKMQLLFLYVHTYVYWLTGWKVCDEDAYRAGIKCQMFLKIYLQIKNIKIVKKLFNSCDSDFNNFRYFFQLGLRLRRIISEKSKANFNCYCHTIQWFRIKSRWIQLKINKIPSWNLRNTLLPI